MQMIELMVGVLAVLKQGMAALAAAGVVEAARVMGKPMHALVLVGTVPLILAAGAVVVHIFRRLPKGVKAATAAQVS